MSVRVLFIILVAILGGFFYLHQNNPATVTVLFYKEYTYTFPVVYFLVASFFAGVFLMTVNSLIAGVRRSIRGFSKNRKLKEKEANDADYHKGMRALARGETVTARTYLVKAIKSNPKDTSLVVSLAKSYMGERRPKEALGALESGLAANPGSINLLSSIGETALGLGDMVKAAWAFEEVLGHDKSNPMVLRELRDILIKQRKWHKAVALQKKVVEADGSRGVRNSKGSDLSVKREEALYASLLYESALLDEHEGKLKEAAIKLTNALKLEPAFIGAILLQGTVTTRLTGLATAIKGWEKALGLCPDSHAVLMRLEDAYIKEARPEDALERYKERIKTDPGDNGLRVILARLYLKLEMVDNAIEELESLHGDMIENAFTRTLLGVAYMRHGRVDDAAKQFINALEVGSGEIKAPFTCSRCSYSSKGYKSRCPVCLEWNSLRLSAASVIDSGMSTGAASAPAPGRT